MILRIAIVLLISASINAHGDGEVVQELSCNFNGDHENGEYCFYRVAPNTSSIDWSLESSDDDRWSPALDGPLAGVEGSVKFLQHRGIGAKHSWNHQKAGVLYSTLAPLDGKYCLSLDYYVTGSLSSILITSRNYDSADRDSMRMNRAERDDRYVFFRTERVANSDEWSHYQSPLLFTNGSYLFIIDGHGVAAIDNLKLTKGPCAKPQDDEVLTCNFDGFYEQDPQESCDWLELSGSWRVHHTADQTTGSDSFGDTLELYSSPSSYGLQRAELRTKVFTPEDGPHCLYFWINDQHNYRYNISEVAVESGLVNYFVPQVYEDKDLFRNYPCWAPKSVDIDPAVPIQILLEAEGTQSNIRFDSFELHKGKCPGTGNCDFSKSTCNFILSNSQVRWYRGSGRVARPTVYRRDDVDRDEKFLYLDFTEFPVSPQVNRRPGPFAIGWMYSELIYEPGAYCLQFEYYAERIRYIKVKTQGKVTHLPQQYDYNFEPEPIQVRTIEHSTRWWTGLADIKTQQPWRIELSVGGTGLLTRFEVKSIKLDRDTCTQVLNMRNRTVAFEEVSFHCFSTGHYIPQYRACDGVIDCPMGEDEGEQCREWQKQHLEAKS